MKILLLLFVFGVTSCFSEDSCTLEGLFKCVKRSHKQFLEDPEDLDGYCEENNCALEYLKRCPEVLVGAAQFKEYYQNIRNALCSTHSTIRRKYFENAGCLNNAATRFSNDCSKVNSDFHKGVCENVRELHQCFKDTVTRICGPDAREVFVAIWPRYDCTE